jgi:DNA-binding NtrC family response regulator
MNTDTGTSGRTILLVDDSPRIRPLVREILMDLECQILEADGSEQALELAAGHTGEIDVLITDITMPGRTGMELAALLSERYPRMKVLYMSGYTMPSGPDPGCQFIEKPFRPDVLLGKIQDLLGISE